MPTVHSFHVVPSLPESLHGLRDIAYNLRWAWDPETIALFNTLDPELWEQTGHNPVRMLGSIAQERLRDAALDEAFLAQLERIGRGLDSYLQSRNTWYQRHYPSQSDVRIAYFSMEFGLTECLPIYSGGLGVLSGDHLKSSSDLGLPLVAVGLLYQEGYFRQSLNTDGWQQERYPDNDFYNMPLQLELDVQGEPLCISLDFPGRVVKAQVWKVQVGRIPLYLLDTNIPANSEQDQNITGRLYGGDVEMRLMQEIVLGIGGVRALTALGITPTACHMNEGHSAFMALERARMQMVAHSVGYAEAREAAAAGNLFTTHTPVPAGFDYFTPDLLSRYLGSYVEQMGLPFPEFMALGRVNRGDQGEKFNMAVFALRHAHHVNGVSKLHGQVSRRMVQAGYPGFPEEEVPVGHVTNGVHIRSFISREMSDLLDRYLGARWQWDMSDPAIWAKVDSIPDEELWRVCERRRAALVEFARTRLKAQYEHRNRSEYEIRQTREVLSPNALTIGFARRFATYKRATLLLSDPERLFRLLNDPHRPVQIVMAGKAHPKDDGGKELIRQIVQFASRSEARLRIVFLEDYDLTVARKLVQGVDIWLNTPRRPMEASGTSGMKILANGGLNVSIPDGWWAEGYEPGAGWSIGRGEEYSDPAEQDRLEASALYEILEKEVVPIFYDRNVEGIPRAWLSRVRSSMRLLCPRFNTHRMVAEYADRFYLPSSRRSSMLLADDMARAKTLVAWKQKMREQWNGVKVEGVEMVVKPETADGWPTEKGAVGDYHVGDTLHFSARVRLGGLTPSDVTVQAVHGVLDTNRQVVHGTPASLTWKSETDGLHYYEGDIPCEQSGQQGFSVRVLPTHPDAELPIELSLITWE